MRQSLPSKDPAPHLRDILENVAHLERVLLNVTLDEYVANRDTSALTERYPQIITEASYRLRDDAERFCPGPNWKGWRDLGNVLRHAYDKVDPELIWNTVQFDVPQLKQSVETCLARLKSEAAS